MISVIIPAYQSSRTIVACLESVLGQHQVDLEIIVVDDGSTDDTLALLAAYHDRITLLTREHSGAAAARNAGAKIAKGEYFFFCDSDVILEPRALNTLERALQKHREVSYAYCSFRFDARLMRGVPFHPQWLRRMNYISTMSLIRAVDFPGFDESLERFQDWDLWLTLLGAGKIGVLVPDVLFRTIPRKGISSKADTLRVSEHVVRAKHQLPEPTRLERWRWKLELAYIRFTSSRRDSQIPND